MPRSRPLKKKLTPVQRVERYLDRIDLKRLEENRQIYDMDGWKDDPAFGYDGDEASSAPMWRPKATNRSAGKTLRVDQEMSKKLEDFTELREMHGENCDCTGCNQCSTDDD